MMASVLGMNSVPSPSGLAVGVDDRHRAARRRSRPSRRRCRSGRRRSGPSRRPWPPACCPRGPARRWPSGRGRSALAFSSPQAANRQAACVAVVPKSGLAMPILPFHFGSSRSSIPLGRSASATSLVLTIRMRARAAKPYQVPSLALNVLGQVAGVRRAERGEQPLLLEPERVEDLVVPEQVAPRPDRLGDDQVRQADRLGALDVELGQDLDPRPASRRRRGPARRTPGPGPSRRPLPDSGSGRPASPPAQPPRSRASPQATVMAGSRGMG